LYALAAAVSLALTNLLPLPVRAGVVAAVDRVRRSCGASDAALARSARLRRVARLVAAGESLERAERNAGYRAARSLEIHLTGVTSEAAIATLMRRQFCRALGRPGLGAIGVYRRGNAIWIALAKPLTVPPAAAAAAVERRVLELTNRARARARRCGALWFPRAAPLRLSRALSAAALAHSRDMAARGFLSHRGSDGSTPGERVTRAGYSWRLVGENIASGFGSADRAVAGWLASPHHCANIMTAGFRRLGVAFAVNPTSPADIYWTEDFAAPRRPLRTPAG
jgi:uncharacterized protein YkwD/predicted DCC family thiol-disulfide oxidoreductase YuxK